MARNSVIVTEKENVLIQAGDFSVTVFPRLGGKIGSLRLRDSELLQPPLAPYAPRTRAMAFDEADASGWDECLPSVAACSIAAPGGSASIPDHGDLWRVSWETVDSDALSLTLNAECFSLPLTLRRALTLAETNNGCSLHLDYTLTSTGSYPVPWSWAAHPLFSAEPGDSIELPSSIQTLRVEGSAANRLGANGNTVHWPLASGTNGKLSDLSVVYPPASGFGDKLFAGPLGPSDGWCALRRPKAGVRIKVSFDTAATPYLGLWLCYGGWPDKPGPKQACVALEPATAPVDSLAQTGSWSRTLFPGQSYEWLMHVDLEII